MASFDAKVALVTGGANGIGAACVRRLARDGAAVVVADIADGSGDKLAAEIASGGADVVYRHADVSTREAWEGLSALIRDRWGRLDVVVSNAYARRVDPAHDLPEESWDHQLAVNVKPLYLAAATLIDLLRQNRGTIVAISSVHATFGFPGNPAYAASKGAICALVRQLAAEYGPEVRVNSVLPGRIRTQKGDNIVEEGRRQAAAATPLARVGDPEEVASVVTFLASDEASYVTGASLTVDGGFSVVKHTR